MCECVCVYLTLKLRSGTFKHTFRKLKWWTNLVSKIFRWMMLFSCFYRISSDTFSVCDEYTSFFSHFSLHCDDVFWNDEMMIQSQTNSKHIAMEWRGVVWCGSADVRQDEIKIHTAHAYTMCVCYVFLNYDKLKHKWMAERVRIFIMNICGIFHLHLANSWITKINKRCRKCSYLTHQDFLLIRYSSTLFLNLSPLLLLYLFRLFI